MSADINYLPGTFADVADLVIDGLTIDPASAGVDPATLCDLVKLSHARRITLRNLVVRGGKQRENAIDANRMCEDVLIDGAELEAGRQNAITIKGGCRRIHLRNVLIARAGGHCDIELGNWSDQSFERVTKVTLENVRRADGKPVRLRVGHAAFPTIIGGNVRYMRIESYALKAYCIGHLFASVFLELIRWPWMRSISAVTLDVK